MVLVLITCFMTIECCNLVLLLLLLIIDLRFLLQKVKKFSLAGNSTNQGETAATANKA